MEIEIFNLLIAVAGAIYFMLPAYVANHSVEEHQLTVERNARMGVGLLVMV